MKQDFTIWRNQILQNPWDISPLKFGMSQDEIECFPDVFALIERELRQCKLDSAAMKPVEALDGKL